MSKEARKEGGVRGNDFYYGRVHGDGSRDEGSDLFTGPPHRHGPCSGVARTRSNTPLCRVGGHAVWF